MKTRFAAGVAALSALVALAPVAGLQAAEVTVSATAPGGSRTVFVENLVGAPLQSLDFGSSRAQPFRVRVVDATMSRSNFSVSASMTSLYPEIGSAVDLDGPALPITSANLGIDYPTNPLGVNSVAAVVEPVLDLVATVTGATCTLLTTLGRSCLVNMNDVDALQQQLALPVDLNALSNLPLLPQTGQAGTFTNPAYAGVAAAAPRPSTAPAATQLEVLSGSAVANIALGPLDTVLQTLVATTPAVNLVDEEVLRGALRTALGTNLASTAIFDTLSATDIQVILATVTATANALLAGDLLAQSGTYLSFPVLELAVPTSAAPGTYKGTLVVTALQG